MKPYYERDGRDEAGRFVRGHAQPKTDAHRAAISRACRIAWGTKRKRIPLGAVGHKSGGYQMVKVSEGRWRGEHILAAERALGRRLARGEVVHHIDMTRDGNASENLHVFASKAAHNKAHASLNALVAGLLRDGVVRFDREAGVYVR